MHLTFKTTPADERQFLQAWDASFGWEMMRLSGPGPRRSGGTNLLRDRHLQKRSRTGVRREEIAAHDLAATITRKFGLDPKLLKMLRGQVHLPRVTK